MGMRLHGMGTRLHGIAIKINRICVDVLSWYNWQVSEDFTSSSLV